MDLTDEAEDSVFHCFELQSLMFLQENQEIFQQVLNQSGDEHPVKDAGNPMPWFVWHFLGKNYRKIRVDFWLEHVRKKVRKQGQIFHF